MISVNTNLKNAITGKGSQMVRIYGACYDTSDAYHTFTWTNADIVQGSFYVDKRCVSGSQFSFGNTVSNELGFEIFGSYEDWLLEGVTVMVELGGYVSGTATYFELGKFVLDKPVQKLGRLTFRGYDDLTKLDQNADNWVMNANSGENILGQAIKPSSSYLMNADGYMNFIAGSVTTPYYNSNPLSAATGMVPLAQNGRYPQKIVIKATGPAVDLSSSYFLLFRYNGGVLENVGGLRWPFINAPLYMTASTISAGEYHIDFGLNTDETYFQEYLESNYGVNDYYATFTLTTSATPSFTAIEIGYDRVAAAKIGDIVDDVCEACGLDFFAGYPAPVNLTEAYTNLVDYSQYSYRTILGLFAQACGANLTLWPSGYGLYNGQVRFAVPTATGITLTEADVLSCDLADEPVLINGTRFVSSDGALFINRTDNTEPYKYFDFTGCPVFPKDAQTAIDNLSALTGSSMTWLPGQAKILAQPWLEPMDVVNFAYTKAPNYAGRFMITRVRINAMGSTYIESAGFVESTPNSNGYVPTDYTQVDPFGVVYSNYNETIVPGLTSNVPMASFTKNLPTVNDYVRADSGFGIVTDINGSFATVEWLAEAGGGGGGVTYEFTGGTQSFTAEDSLGNTQSVAIKPQIFKGTCATAAGTVAKVVTCPEFTSADLVTGAVIFVTFSATNSGTAANLTLNVNGTGAKGIRYMRNAAESNLPGNSYLRANMTYRFVYTGTYWVCDTDYDADTVAYRIRSNSGTLTMQAATYQYRVLFMSADNTKWVPSTTSTSTNATSARAVNQEPINPFGDIVYYNSSTTVAAGSRPAATTLMRQYGLTFGYSFNRTGAALTLTSWRPIYIKCAPQADGSAIIDADTPYVQTLPSTADGKIYIYFGIAYSATAVELMYNHPVYYYKDGEGIVPWTGAVYDAPRCVTFLTSDQDYGWTPDATPSSPLYTVTGTCTQGTYSDIVAANAAGKAVFVIDDAKIFDYGGYDDVKVYELVCSNPDDGLVTLITSQDAANYLDEILTVHSTDAFDLRDKLPSPHTHISTQIEANATEAAAVESGDALIFVDSNDSNKLKRMTSGFDTGNTTSYLCKDGTWSVPAGGNTAGIFKGTCATGAGGDPKAVTCPEFTSSDLVKGAVIFVTFSYTNSVSVNTVQMNVNGTGAKRIMQRKNTVVGTMTTNGEILANQTYMFTYDGTYWVLSNDDDRTNVSALGNGHKNIGTTNRYQFLVSAPKDDTNTNDHKRALFAINAVDTGSTVYTKAFRTWSFDPFGVFAYWNSADRVSSEGTFGDPTRLQIEGSVAGNYGFNLKQNGTAGTQGLVDNKAVYMKSKYDFVTQTATLWQNTASDNYLDRSGLVQELPTTNPNTSTDTYIYIYLGQAYGGDARTFYLLPYHPVYMWNNAKGTMDLFTGAPMDGNGTFTLTDNMGLTFTANYYKIGRQVTVWGTIPSNSSTASALAGLPFEASGNFQTTLTWTDSSLMMMVVARVSVTAGATNLIPMGYAKVGVSSTSNAGSWLGQIPTSGVPFNFTYITN